MNRVLSCLLLLVAASALKIQVKNVDLREAEAAKIGEKHSLEVKIEGNHSKVSPSKENRTHHMSHHKSRHHQKLFSTGKITHFSIAGSVDAQFTAFGLEGSLNLYGAMDGDTLTLGGELALFGYVTVIKFKAGVTVAGSVELTVKCPEQVSAVTATLAALKTWLINALSKSKSLKSMRKLTSTQLQLWESAREESDLTNESDLMEALTSEIRLHEVLFVNRLQIYWNENRANHGTVLDFHQKIIWAWSEHFLFGLRVNEVKGALLKFYYKHEDKNLHGVFSFLKCSSNNREITNSKLQKAYCRFFKAGFFLLDKVKDLKFSDIVGAFKVMYPQFYSEDPAMIQQALSQGGSASGGRLELLGVSPVQFLGEVTKTEAMLVAGPYQVDEVALTGSVSLKAGWYSGTVSADIVVGMSKKWVWTRQNEVGSMKMAAQPTQFTLQCNVAPWFSFTAAFQYGKKTMNPEMSFCFQGAFIYKSGNDAGIEAKFAAAAATLKTDLLAASTSTTAQTTVPDQSVGANAMFRFMKWVKSDPTLREGVNLMTETPIPATAFGAVVSSASDVAAAILDISGLSFGQASSMLCIGAALDITGPRTSKISIFASFEAVTNFAITANVGAAGGGFGGSLGYGAGYSYSE